MMTAQTESDRILDSLSPRAPIHKFTQSGYTSLCCERTADPRHPCARSKDDECHFAEYPIYACSVSFEQLKNDEWVKDGLWMSGTAFREGRDDVRAAILYVNDRIKSSAKYEAVRNVSFSLTFKGHDTWIQGWFSHWTFDIGLSDADVIASFREFVDRKEVENERARGDATNWKDGYFTEPYCLMGAVDRWRWCSRPEGTSLIGSGERSDAVPCRCDGCKANGVVRIDH